MSIPNTLAFARNINLANTTLSPALLLHCAFPLAARGENRWRLLSRGNAFTGAESDRVERRGDRVNERK